MQEKYQCHICMQRAQKPVVTPCGHLFCWTCIYLWLRSNQQYLTCPICKSGLQIPMLRPIYPPVANPPSQKSQSGIPPRPRPIKSAPKKNPSSTLPVSIEKVGMNLYRGVLLAGYGLFPSCYSMIWHNHQAPLKEEGPFASDLEYRLGRYLEMGFFAALGIGVGVVALLV